MVSCSATQRSSWSASASSCVGGVAEVRGHEEQPRGRVGVEDRELVLPEHAAREEAGDRARLRGQQRAEAGADDAAERAEPVAQAVGDRVQHALERGEVGLGPLVAADGLGDRQRRGRREAGVGADEALALLGGALEGLERRGIAGGLQARDPAGDLGGEGPVDHPSHGGRATSAEARKKGVRHLSCGRRRRRRELRARRPRACARRPRASAARGPAGRRAAPSQAVKATWPPASRTISWPAAASTARQLRSVVMPSSRAPATWQSVTAIVPIARRRWLVSTSASAASRIQRGSADSIPTSSSLPSRVRRSPIEGSRRSPSSGRAGAALGHPLLAGPEVVDVAEDDVGHRRAPRRPRSRARGGRCRAWRSSSRRSGRRSRASRRRRSRRCRAPR